MKNKKTINRVLQLIRPYTYLVVSILVLAAVTVAADPIFAHPDW